MRSLPHFVSLAVCALFAACVFTPPPPLPGEGEGLGGEPIARGAPSNQGEAEQATGSAGMGAGAGAGGGGESRFVRGQEPETGMDLDDILAFNAAQGDPVEGLFEIEAALEGLPEEGELWVEIVTARGIIDCLLYEDLTPVTVANFVGLARGRRPWYERDSDEWIEGQPYYDGTVFHRVIPGFMVQGGDPSGTGRGNPGYVIPDEILPELGHDGGALAMANKGPNTGSAQFFVVLEPAVHLDGLHTVFGRCTAAGVEVANAVAGVAVGENDKPVEDEILRELRIVRRPK